MSIYITETNPIVPCVPFDISDFNLHAEAIVTIEKGKSNIWDISLLCVLDISKEEDLRELIKVEMSATEMCCDLITMRKIILSPKKHHKGEETLWRIRLKAELDIYDSTRIMDIIVAVETTRPRKKKTRTMAQLSVEG